MRTALFLMAALAAQAQYFPLQVGNQWIYRVDNGPVKDLRIAEVIGVETVNEKEYFRYRDILGKVSRIRTTEADQLVELQGDGSETVWADFAAAEGANYATSFDECTGRATVESKNTSAAILGRTWENGISIKYQAASCADAGVEKDLYLPGLGLAERTYLTFTGPRNYKLSYARIGNASIVASGEYSFRVNLDKQTYPAPPHLHLRLTLENWTNDPLKLTFFSGQMYDFTIKNERGESVYTWSATRLFPAVISEISVVGEKNWTVSEEVDLRPGNYVLEAWLTNGRQPTFRGQIPFSVAEVVKE